MHYLHYPQKKRNMNSLREPHAHDGLYPHSFRVICLDFLFDQDYVATLDVVFDIQINPFRGAEFLLLKQLKQSLFWMR